MPLPAALPLVVETRVFASSQRLGNPVRVVLGADRASAQQTAEQAERGWPFALCKAWPTPGREAAARLAVSCQQQGQPIHFCGHGLLAVAQLWFTLTGEVPTLVADNRLFISALPATSAQSVWLQVERPDLVRDPTLLPLSRWLRPAPRGVKAATAGAAQGYRLLQLPQTVELAALQADVEAIAAFDERALLLIQAVSSAAQEAPAPDYRLRYFAPQYGNDEDAATGSAHVVAAAWWSARLGKRILRGEQCPGSSLQTGATARSPAVTEQPLRQPGGIVISRVEQKSVAIASELPALYRL